MTLEPNLRELVESAARLISQADALIIAAGAGMGVDSGLPDFRGVNGFWKAYPALARAKKSFEDIASPEAFQDDPATARGFYGHRLKLHRDTPPHPGFELLKIWGGKLDRGCCVFTSNIDGHFQAAGFSVNSIYECHGSIHYLQCTKPCRSDVWSADGFSPVVDEEACRLLSELPVCPHCRRLARPNVMMFSDFEWLEERAEPQSMRLKQWLSTVRRPVVVEIGAGTAIPSVRSFSHNVVRRHSGRLIRINPREFDVPTRDDVALPMGSVEALSLIAVALGPSWASQTA
ncbi:NAD-dependent SIR2 family protein deacetylase [Variovorax boronicumulans]|uniref:SIR2 family NAD-dependent protein deacylase n=1 Tax=Variovorax boronicumulans TaxID=436515 RepID=UPI00277E12D1|nr:Sir2 family NAD-dependent protein deacetylase [Variovorax boronicumulans]MDQ0035115.1 NAD-dependent SIR2 family protein deacetylase [Variovorax boronicumulans]